MKFPKKIIAVFCCIAITISCMVVPASASLAGAAEVTWEAIQFLDWGLNKIEDWRTANPDKDISEYPGFNPGGMFGDGFGADRTEAEEAYTSYVSDLQTDLGSTTLIDGGVRIYPTVYPLEVGEYLAFTEKNLGNPFSAILLLLRRIWGILLVLLLL